jgi:Putative methyltransferase
MNALHLAVRKLRWSLIHRGLKDTLRLPARRLTEPKGPRFIPITHPFDTEHGVDTSGLIGGVHLASNHPNDIFTTAYCAIPPSRLRAMLDRWLAIPPERPLTDYTFIDIGCGKGRAVMLASQLPFKEVIGVELNPSLAQTAITNLKIWHSTGNPTCPARIVNDDATTLILPTTPCIIYLYNPFSTIMMQRLIQHLDQTFTAHPHPLDILYFTPDSGHLFANHPHFSTLLTASIPISYEDALVEPPIAVIDQCTAYRYTPKR